MLVCFPRRRRRALSMMTIWRLLRVKSNHSPSRRPVRPFYQRPKLHFQPRRLSRLGLVTRIPIYFRLPGVRPTTKVLIPCRFPKVGLKSPVQGRPSRPQQKGWLAHAHLAGLASVMVQRARQEARELIKYQISNFSSKANLLGVCISDLTWIRTIDRCRSHCCA